MYKLYFILVTFIILFSSCASIKTQTQREFVIYYDTPVTVVYDWDPIGLAPMIEMKLLELGIDAVPYEVAERYVEEKSGLDVQTYPDGFDAGSRTRVSQHIVTPTVIIIKFAYGYYEKPFGIGLGTFNCRIIDLETNRVLAVVSFQGGYANDITPNRAVNKVGEVLSKRLQER